MRRDLFVFAGQSNMMGACVYPPKEKLSISRSYEYKHKQRRLGEPWGSFVPAGYPAGEFSYIDLERAYALDMANEKGESLLNNYIDNTYFCPAMSSLMLDQEKTEHSFSFFSEATAPAGATLAPFLAEEWEKRGFSCAYAHIAKGGVKIAYYFTDEMAEEYTRRITLHNQTNGTDYRTVIPEKSRTPKAAEYFLAKCKDFMEDGKQKFSKDTLASRSFFWLQGESDARDSETEYRIKLQILWDSLKQVGFTHFFCIRVDYFGDEAVKNVMLAQESFVRENDDAFMLTRCASYFIYAGRDESKWFSSPPDEEYQNCRDSFFGYQNQHINEKGFSLIAKRSAQNLYRVLVEKKEPILEEENIRSMMNKREHNYV